MFCLSISVALLTLRFVLDRCKHAINFLIITAAEIDYVNLFLPRIYLEYESQTDNVHKGLELYSKYEVFILYKKSATFESQIF